MGKPQFLSSGLTALFLFFTGCGGDDAGLLASVDIEEIYSGAGGGSFGVTSKNPADFGTITGKVNYEGRRRVHRLQLYKDYCINRNANGMLSEDFRVGPEGQLGSVIVYVKRGLSKVKFPVPSESVVLDQKSCRYIPHVAVVQIGQEFIIRNSDNTEHNVHWMPVVGLNPEFNTPMNSPFDLDPKILSKRQVAASVKCDIHGWMQSYIAVLPHPCWAITKDDGTFEIKGVPPGTLQLGAWHEALGELTVDITQAKNENKTQDFTFPGKQ